METQARRGEPLEVKVARMEEKVENIEATVVRIERALISTQQTFVTHQEMKFRDREIQELKNNQTWLWRTVVGAVILGFIGLLFLAAEVFVKGGLT